AVAISAELNLLPEVVRMLVLIAFEGIRIEKPRGQRVARGRNTQDGNQLHLARRIGHARDHSRAARLEARWQLLALQLDIWRRDEHARILAVAGRVTELVEHEER